MNETALQCLRGALTGFMGQIPGYSPTVQLYTTSAIIVLGLLLLLAHKSTLW